MGTCAAFGYFVRPSAIHPSPAFLGGYAVAVAVSTAIAWAPYLVSWYVTRTLIWKSMRKVWMFIGIAFFITAISVPMYVIHISVLDGIQFGAISVCVALLLTLTAYLCSLPRSANDEN